MIDLKPACRQMIELLNAFTEDQLTSPTPCAEYTLHALIDHIDEASVGFAAVARKDSSEQSATVSASQHTMDGADGRRNGLRDSVAKHVEALGEAWDDPAAWQGSTEAAGIELSNELWGKVALTEMVVHGWDVARSIDRPVHFPEHTLRACLEHVKAFVPHAPIPELWDAAVTVPPDSSLLDQIVAATGRTP